MATTVARLEAVLSANTKDFDRGMDQSESKMSSLAKTAGKAGLAGALIGVGIAAKIGFDEFSQAAKVTAQTDAVLKSTGKSAGVTTDQVTGLAGALLKKSGIDDEVIQSGENMLLTFTNIRNEAGKGNDIFNQTTKATLDLSVAMGKDMTSSAILVGKAMNQMTVNSAGNVTGFSALRRVGVQLTQQQNDQAAAMIKSGDVIGAQKILLGELNKEFGGSAEALGKTLPGQINIAKETFRNFAGDVVAKVIPVLEDIISFVQAHWPEISKTINDAWVGTIKPVLEALGDLIRTVVGIVRDNWSTIGPIVKNVAVVIEDAVKIITGALRIITDLLKGDWSKAWIDMQGVGKTALDLLKSAALVFVGPFLQIFNGLWETLKDEAKRAWDGVVGVVRTALDALTGAFKSVKDWVSAHWPEIAVLVSGPFAPMVALATNAFGVRDHLQDAFTAVKDFVSAHWPEIATIISGPFAPLVALATGAFGVRKALTDAFGAVKDDVSSLVSGIVGFWRDMPGQVAKAIGDGAGAVRDAVLGIFDSLPGAVKKLLGISSPSTVFAEIGANIIHGVIAGLDKVGPQLLDKASGLLGSVAGTVSSAASSVGGVLGIGSTASTPQALGKQLASLMYGWNGAQWDALNALFQQESGWNPTARNPASGAYGIPQALPPTKMPFAAQAAGGSNPFAQIQWGLQYIKSRYGDPLTAWGGYWQRGGWYHTGGIVPGEGNVPIVAKGGEGIFTRGQMAAMGGGGTHTTQVYIGGERVVDVFWDGLRQRAKVFERRNGRPAF